MTNWLWRSQHKITSPAIQNEILQTMALHIVRKINAEISGKWFSLMIDETTDLSNCEQMVVCLRYVNDDLSVHEKVIGLYSLESTSANTIVSTAK